MIKMKNTRDNRGATYVAGAIISLIILGGVIVLITNGLLIQEVSQSPEQRSTDADLQNELDEIMKVSANDGTMKNRVLLWNDLTGEWEDDEAQNTGIEFRDFPTDRFSERLNQYTEQNNLRINIYVYGTDSQVSFNQSSVVGVNEKSDPVPIYTEGEPGDQAVSSQKQITLFESDRTKSPTDGHGYIPNSPNTEVGDGQRLDEFSGDGSDYPIERGSSISNVYNTVVVEVVVWEI